MILICFFLQLNESLYFCKICKGICSKIVGCCVDEILLIKVMIITNEMFLKKIILCKYNFFFGKCMFRCGY